MRSSRKGALSLQETFSGPAKSLHEKRQELCRLHRNWRETSGEGADQGLEQGFIVTFNSEGDRNYYVGQPVVTDSGFYDPKHQAFKDFVGPLLASTAAALVFDFTVGK